MAINPRDGQIYAMGSLPSFNPTLLSASVSQAAYDRLTEPQRGEPLLNRATQSAGPTGSTFTPITAVAALSSGEWSADSVFDDTGQFCVGTGAG